MARTNIALTTLDQDGASVEGNEVAFDQPNGMDFVNDGSRTYIAIKEAGAVAKSLTINTPGNVAGNAIADLVVTSPASETTIIGPLSAGVYNQDDPDAGKVFLDIDVGTGVTVTVFKV